MSNHYPDAPGYVDRDTSFEAAIRIEPTAGSLRFLILNHIRRTAAATCDEIEVDLELRHQTASARVRELFLLGFVVDTGERRRTRSGRRAIIWAASADVTAARSAASPEPPEEG